MKITIVGGGTAAYYSACLIHLLHHRTRKQAPTIDIIVPKDSSPIGVGEGSLPAMVSTLTELKILPSDIDATNKLAVFYKNWYSEKDSEHNNGYHIFPSEKLNDMKAEELWEFNKKFHNIKQLNSLHTYRINTRATYAYHFDTHLLLEKLRNCAHILGCKTLTGTVKKVEKTKDEIKAITLNNGIKVKSDYYIDCTGFKRVLMSEFSTEIIDFSNEILVDSAISVSIPGKNSIENITTTEALSSGWKWTIPLRTKTGHGYVYSSKFLSKQEAKKEFLEAIGIPENSNLKFQEFKWTPSVQKINYVKNACGLGLASGFVEPLEATSLGSVTNAIGWLVFGYWGNPDADYKAFNDNGIKYFTDIKDFLLTAYTSSKRKNSKFWRYYSKNISYSERIKEKLKTTPETLDGNKRNIMYHISNNAKATDYIIKRRKERDFKLRSELFTPGSWLQYKTIFNIEE